MTETGKQGGGLDPSRMLDIMADLECALVMTREHDPTETVGGFVDCSIQFKRLADFLHSVQHDPIATEATHPSPESPND
jgi:hypothetical protein